MPDELTKRLQRGGPLSVSNPRDPAVEAFKMADQAGQLAAAAMQATQGLGGVVKVQGHRIQTAESTLGLIIGFLIERALPAIEGGEEMAAELKKMHADHKQWMAVQALPRRTLSSFLVQGVSLREVEAATEEHPETGAAVVVLLVHRASPLYEGLNGKVFRGKDLGKAIHPADARVQAERGRIPTELYDEIAKGPTAEE